MRQRFTASRLFAIPGAHSSKDSLATRMRSFRVCLVQMEKVLSGHELRPYVKGENHWLKGVERPHSGDVTINQEGKSRVKHRISGNLHAKILSRKSGESEKIVG